MCFAFSLKPVKVQGRACHTLWQSCRPRVQAAWLVTKSAFFKAEMEDINSLSDFFDQRTRSRGGILHAKFATPVGNNWGGGFFFIKTENDALSAVSPCSQRSRGKDPLAQVERQRRSVSLISECARKTRCGRSATSQCVSTLKGRSERCIRYAEIKSSSCGWIDNAVFHSMS